MYWLHQNNGKTNYKLLRPICKYNTYIKSHWKFSFNTVYKDVFRSIQISFWCCLKSDSCRQSVIRRLKSFYWKSLCFICLYILYWQLSVVIIVTFVLFYPALCPYVGYVLHKLPYSENSLHTVNVLIYAHALIDMQRGISAKKINLQLFCHFHHFLMMLLAIFIYLQSLWHQVSQNFM